MPEETKVCPLCDATIGKTDATCPSCNEEIENVDEEAKVVERANKLLEKRRLKANPPTPPVPQPQPKKKTSIFQSLALKKKGQ